MIRIIATVLAVLVASASMASQDYLIKLKDTKAIQDFGGNLKSGSMKRLSLNNWVKASLNAAEVQALRSQSQVLHIERNFKLSINSTMESHDPVIRQMAMDEIAKNGLRFGRIKDNPDFPGIPEETSGADKLFKKQWGMADIGAAQAWENSGTKGRSEVVVAVIDTGVDYTHEDLLPNMWRNPGESGLDEAGNPKATNGIDDDGNGYIDDLMGWDFAMDDNKPFDNYRKGFSVLLGGNAGHGTHCAGNVAARGENGKGIAGVAPNVKIMALRFLGDGGSGTTEDDIEAIRYAVDNGARVLSNSWGSVGEDGDPQLSLALQEAIQYAQDNDVIFIAASGNGRLGRGYDNDGDSAPAFPASYPQETIVSVAAVDKKDRLGSFSNWGLETVDIGAPGVAIFSTVPGNRYRRTALVFPKLSWDGTSMATPHVAGAAALYLSKYPDATFAQVKQALIASAAPIDSLQDKVVSNGKLDVEALMQVPLQDPMDPVEPVDPVDPLVL